jgi:hypothetical protein
MKYAAAALLLFALPAPAMAQTACAALERLATAMTEPEPFASVGRSLANGEAIVPGFSAADCRVADGAVTCRTTDFVMRHFAGWPDPLGCGTFGAEISRVRTVPDWHHALVLRDLYFSYGVSCVGCAGGTVSWFVAMSQYRPRVVDWTRR